MVTFTLDSRYQFPKDTSAKILTSGLLGEQYVGLEAGGESEMLQAGDE
jgi:phospholipid/cholesterol/gamma-HCH transport system substrate-binding protein